MAIKTIKIAVFGLDHRLMNALTLVLKHRAGNRFVLENDADARLAICAQEGNEADHIWQELKDHFPTLPVIVIADKPSKRPGVIEMLKPLSVTELVATIERVADGRVEEPGSGVYGVTTKALEQRIQNKQKDVRAPRYQSHAQDRGITYSPDDFVQGLLLRASNEAREQSKVAELVCWLDRTIIIDPHNDTIYSSLNDVQQRNIGVVSLSAKEGMTARYALHSQDQLPELLVKAGDELHVYPLEQFIWKSTVLTARGRVPEGTDLDKPCYLRFWPNLTRVYQIPDAFSITALWIRQPRSLNELQALLDVPLESVLTFYSAANAIGIAAPVEDELHSHGGSTPIEIHSHRSLFSTILQKFTGNVAMNNVPSTSMTG